MGSPAAPGTSSSAASSAVLDLRGGQRAGHGLDLARLLQRLGGHPEVGEAAGGDQHPALERAHRLVVGHHARVERPADAVQVPGHRAEPHVQLLAELLHGVGLRVEHLVLPALGDRAEQRDQRGRAWRGRRSWRRPARRGRAPPGGPPAGWPRRAGTAPRTPACRAAPPSSGGSRGRRRACGRARRAATGRGPARSGRRSRSGRGTPPAAPSRRRRSCGLRRARRRGRGAAVRRRSAPARRSRSGRPDPRARPCGAGAARPTARAPVACAARWRGCSSRDAGSRWTAACRPPAGAAVPATRRGRGRGR